MLKAEEIIGVIDEVTEETGHIFAPCELAEVLSLTGRKCQLKRTGDDYFPLLLETELKEFLISQTINGTKRRPDYERNCYSELAGTAVC